MTPSLRAACALGLALGACAPGPVEPSPQATPTPSPPNLAWSQAFGDDLDVVVRRGGETRRLRQPGTQDFAGPVSPQGDALVVVRSARESADPTQQLWLVPLDGGAERALSAPAPVVRSPAWAPDGSAVVYESALDGFRDLYRADRAGRTTRLSTSAAGCFEPAPLGDGRTVIAPCSGRDVELYRLSGGPPDTPLRSRSGSDGAPALAPDGRRVAFLASDGPRWSVQQLDLDTGDLRPIWAPDPGGPTLVPEQGLRWSPDGAALLAVSRGTDGAPTVLVLDPSTRRIRARVPGELPEWAPDGGVFVTHTDASGQGVFHAPVGGAPARRVAPPGAWLGRPL